MAASISKALTSTRTRILLHLTPSLSTPFSSTSSAIPTVVPPVSNPNPSPQPQPQAAKKGRGIWSKMLLFVPGAITFGLGTWQIFRRHDKIKMLDYREERMVREPVELNAISPAEYSNTLEFRRIVCRGFFDEKKSIFVGPRSRSISGVTENGYCLITPLFPNSGDPESVQVPVLVNRGWVPRSWKDKSLEPVQDAEEAGNAPSSSSHGESHSLWKFWSKRPKRDEEQAPHVSSIEVIGVVRGSEKPSIFVPENDPNSGQWFYVDVSAIARASGLSENAIYVEDINENVSPSNPYPIPKDASTLIRSSVMPQDHLNYTLTCWGRIDICQQKIDLGEDLLCYFTSLRSKYLVEIAL